MYEIMEFLQLNINVVLAQFAMWENTKLPCRAYYLHCDKTNSTK